MTALKENSSSFQPFILLKIYNPPHTLQLSKKHSSFIFQAAGWSTESRSLNSHDLRLTIELESLKESRKPADAR